MDSHHSREPMSKLALGALGVRVGTNPTEVAEIVADTLK